jgi:uncharacterized lipoprotein YajG
MEQTMVKQAALACTRLFACASALALSACASDPQRQAGAPATPSATVNLLNRTSWGVDASSVKQVDELGWNAYIARQLHPQASALPIAAQARSTP